MLQKQHSQMACSSTPDNIKNERIKSHHTIAEIPEALLMESLMKSYDQYKSSQIRRGLLAKIASRLCEICAVSLDLCRQIWREIIPEELRGNIENEPSANEQRLEEKQQKCFEQFRIKKARFFVIVFDDQSSQDEMQQAFQKASFIAAEGRGITIEELVKQTNCASWRIKNWSRTKRYSILFFKFDLFGHLLYFGNLTKEMIDSNREEEHYFDSFKQDLVSAYEHYQIVQRQFVNSYMEKEDRLQLQLE